MKLHIAVDVTTEWVSLERCRELRDWMQDRLYNDCLIVDAELVVVEVDREWEPKPKKRKTVVNTLRPTTP